MDKTQVVSTCVECHAFNDRYLAKVYRRQETQVKAVVEGLKLGMIPDGMDAKIYLWKQRVALGKIAEAALYLAEAHPVGTAHAKANGADLGKITEAGGVKLPQPEFSTMDTGR